MKITGDDDDYPEPDPPSNKAALWALGIGLWLLTPIVLLQMTWLNETARFVCMLVAVGMVVAAAKVCIAASKADQNHAENMRHRANAKESHLKHEQSQISIRNARRQAEENAYYEEQKRKTEIAQLETQRSEAEARRRIIDTAERQGLTVDQTYGLNEHKYLADYNRQASQDEKKLDFALEMKRKEIEQYLEKDKIQLQLSAADAVDYYSIIQQLEDEIEQLDARRREIELTEKDEVLKAQKLARVDRKIKRIEDDIDARQTNHNRFLSSQNGKDPRKLT